MEEVLGSSFGIKSGGLAVADCCDGMGWMGRSKDMARLVLDVGFWKGKGRGRRDVFVGVWVLGGCGGWGTFFLRVAFWRGWVSGVACLGMRNSCR